MLTLLMEPRHSDIQFTIWGVNKNYPLQPLQQLHHCFISGITSPLLIVLPAHYNWFHHFMINLNFGALSKGQMKLHYNTAWLHLITTFLLLNLTNISLKTPEIACKWVAFWVSHLIIQIIHVATICSINSLLGNLLSYDSLDLWVLLKLQWLSWWLSCQQRAIIAGCSACGSSLCQYCQRIAIKGESWGASETKQNGAGAPIKKGE